MTEDRRYALLSVTDKTGVVEFAKGLVELGFTILSTGGTRRALLEGGVEAIEVADHPGFPEMMAGRVKPLHPKEHGGPRITEVERWCPRPGARPPARSEGLRAYCGLRRRGFELVRRTGGARPGAQRLR